MIKHVLQHATPFSIVLLSFMLTIKFSTTAQEKGHLIITTDPPQAQLELIDFPDIKKTSPAEFKSYLSLPYRVRIQKHNYLTIDTIVLCKKDTISSYHFQLTPKQGYLSVTSNPDSLKVFFNNKYIGLTPIDSIKVPCGAHDIEILGEPNIQFKRTYVINEDAAQSINKDFSPPAITTNPTYSQPAIIQNEESSTDEHFNSSYNYSSSYTETEQNNYTEESPIEYTPPAFGTLGVFTMVGTNGLDGATYRYGADILHILRFFGESNKKANVTGYGVEVVIPADLGGAGVYGKCGYMARKFTPKGEYKSSSVSFVTFGGGLTIKPTPHFQVFGELEISLFDEEQDPVLVNDWKSTKPDYSPFNAFVGVRFAF